MNNLLPCPFCGGQPSFERVGTPRASCIVACGNCGCRHESSDEDEHSGSSWNDRAALAAPSHSTEGDAAVRSQAFKDCIDAIKGCIAFGQQDVKQPPEGHWLIEFWNVGRQLAAPAPSASPAALTGVQRYKHGFPDMDEAEDGSWVLLSDVEDALLAAQPPAAAEVSQAARDVLTERRRQIEAEGWTPEHDDAHEGGELADAAAALVLEACDYRLAALQHWPWADAIKDAPPRRNLVKAGALILAEIERLDRAAMQKTDEVRA